jgi:hypothetical protein
MAIFFLILELLQHGVSAFSFTIDPMEYWYNCSNGICSLENRLKAQGRKFPPPDLETYAILKLILKYSYLVIIS